MNAGPDPASKTRPPDRDAPIDDLLTSGWKRDLVDVLDTVHRATMEFWWARGVRHLMLPLTTGAVSSPMGLGSDSSPVSVQMHGHTTYLADSMQFLLEYGCRFADHGCFYLMPSFRGEEPDATHLREFFHSEAEIPCDVDTLLGVVEDYVRSLASAILHHHEGLLTAHGGSDHLVGLVTSAPFVRLTFDEAWEALDGDPAMVERDDRNGFRTLRRAGELALIDRFGPALWITHWDPMAVPFYQARDPETGQALQADLLLGPGEVAGAGQRHVGGPEVILALEDHAVDAADYEWYLGMKEHAPLQTSGFGLGVERFLMWALGHDDIRDMQLAPRLGPPSSARP